MKSSLDTVAGLVESVACTGILGRAPSRTTLAQDGAVQESEGSAGSERCCCRSSRPTASLPSTLAEGEAAWWGEVRVTVVPACLYLPSPPRGGEAWWRGEVRCGLALPDDRPAPSARGEGKPPPPLEEGGEAAGSMAGQVPSQQEERGS
jgi:hypothetical protein